MYSFTQQGMAFSIFSLLCCGLFLTAVLSPGQFQTFWSPTAPCSSFNGYRVLTAKPKAPQKITDPWQCGLEKKKKLILCLVKENWNYAFAICCHETINLEEKAANDHSEGASKCSIQYFPSLRVLEQRNQMNQLVYTTPGQLLLPKRETCARLIVLDCANVAEKTTYAYLSYLTP